jgi:acetyl esterase/lipase
MDDSILCQLPPLTIYIGTDDPLYDDCVRICSKLVEMKKDVECRAYIGLNHGICGQIRKNWYPAKVFFNDVCQDLIVRLKEIPCPRKFLIEA